MQAQRRSERNCAVVLFGTSDLVRDIAPPRVQNNLTFSSLELQPGSIARNHFDPLPTPQISFQSGIYIVDSYVGLLMIKRSAPLKGKPLGAASSHLRLNICARFGRDPVLALRR
jgi:hypothetical protein